LVALVVVGAADKERGWKLGRWNLGFQPGGG